MMVIMVTISVELQHYR